MAPSEKWLVALLRVSAAMMLAALVAAVMPRTWIVWIHDECLKLGAFPDQPIAEYLARSLSGMYALLGGFCGLFASDVRRYRSCILFMGAACIVGGPALCSLDLKIGLPFWWVAGEGLFPLVYGAVLLILLRKVAGSTDERR